ALTSTFHQLSGGNRGRGLGSGPLRTGWPRTAAGKESAATKVNASAAIRPRTDRGQAITTSLKECANLSERISEDRSEPEGRGPSPTPPYTAPTAPPRPPRRRKYRPPAPSIRK